MTRRAVRRAGQDQPDVFGLHRDDGVRVVVGGCSLVADGVGPSASLKK